LDVKTDRNCGGGASFGKKILPNSKTAEFCQTTVLNFTKYVPCSPNTAPKSLSFCSLEKAARAYVDEIDSRGGWKARVRLTRGVLAQTFARTVVVW